MTADRTWIKNHQGPPLSIAHRGASAVAFDNTLSAFEAAHELDADMWEVDVRLTADGVPVAFHDPDLLAVCSKDLKIGEVTAADLKQMTEAVDRSAPLFSEVAALAARLGAGIYLDAKEAEAASKAIALLVEHRIDKAIVGANTPESCLELLKRGSPYPLSILVRPGFNPFEMADACGAEIVHPCWERVSDRPDRLLDAAFFSAAQERGLPVVTWHEERLDVMEALVKMPILGICSDQPEMVSRYRRSVPAMPQVVCHRGANKIAPENTSSAARTAWAAGFEYVEIDVRETADGQFVVHHDETLDRTTTATGKLALKTCAELAGFDAGSSFSIFFQEERIPVLGTVLDLALQWRGKLYVEIKQADPIRLVRAVLAKLPVEDVFFWSSNHRWMVDISNAFPEACLMARLQDFKTLDQCLSTFGPGIVEFNHLNANTETFDTVRQAGARAMIAYMGRDEKVIDQILGLEPDLLNLDEPFLTRRRFAKSKPRRSS